MLWMAGVFAVSGAWQRAVDGESVGEKRGMIFEVMTVWTQPSFLVLAR